jgi:hypothetical protein
MCIAHLVRSTGCNIENEATRIRVQSASAKRTQAWMELLSTISWDRTIGSMPSSLSSGSFQRKNTGGVCRLADFNRLVRRSAKRS